MRKMIVGCYIFLLLFCATAHAESVNVKYRGYVDLDKFTCYYTASSFVNRICYQSENEYVIVLLKRTYYHYCRVSAPLVKQWLNASSKGRFYNAHIKGRYDCRLGGIPED